MPYCVKCGAKTGRDDNYCSNCGATQIKTDEKSSEESSYAKVPLVILVALILILPGMYLYASLYVDRTSMPIKSEIGNDIMEEYEEESLDRLEQIKSKPLYDDAVLQYLGLTNTDITNKYGEPKVMDHWGPGGIEFIYEDEGLIFIFAGMESEKVNNIILTQKSRHTLLGVRVGMTFPEIRQIMGEPVWDGIIQTDNEYGMFSSIYYLGDRKDNESEVVVQFFSQSDNSPTESALVMWKAYWW